MCLMIRLTRAKTFFSQVLTTKNIEITIQLEKFLVSQQTAS